VQESFQQSSSLHICIDTVSVKLRSAAVAGQAGEGNRNGCPR
jgi:hypothetical protein